MSGAREERLAPGARQASFRWKDHRVVIRQTPMVRFLWLFKKTEVFVDDELVARSASALSFKSEQGEGTFTDSDGERHRLVFETGAEFRTLGGPVTIWLDGQEFFDGTVGTSVAAMLWGAFLGVGLGIMTARTINILFELGLF